VEAQQSAVPFGPQIVASPVQEGRAWQVFVVVLHTGVVPLQSALETHPTHCDDVPKSLHLGVPPPHAMHCAPQLVSALQTEHTPAPLQPLFVPHGVSVDG